MPRGGGGFRGGGFGGGGGFRGGGFRGGSGGFRSGRVRSSGRPFGRTGSRRTVSRAPRTSSARHRRYGRHRRHYWGHYWRPWWRRPWHWYWWWGRPYRPWYYGPVYWTGGIALAIVILLLVLPLFFTLAFIPFPFTNASTDGTVTYRDTQTLNYNEFWYEKESMKAGQTLEYSMQSQSPVTFLIWNQPFDEFPKDKTITGNYSEVGMTVEGDNDYQYIGYFLQTESTLTFDFTVTGGLIEFFIADAQDLKRWNNWETIYPTVYYPSTSGASDSFSIPHPQDWYIVWYNPLSSSVSVDFNISYEAVGAFDFSDAAVKHEAVEDVDPGTLTVPSSGDWYFFIYFDPFVNPAESVDITFDVSYKTEVTHNDKWLDFQPILLVIGAIIVILLLIAIVQRRSAKRATTAAATTTTPSGEITTTVPSVVKEGKCHRCQFTYKAGDVYCQNCGAKLVGRDYGVSKVSTPATAKNCASCGEALKPGNRYCKNCGAKIKQEKSYEYFPDERKSFFCQLDNEKHPSTDSAYKCVQCSRMVCDDCYDNISKTGLILCPYCKGDLVKAQ